MRAFSCQTAFVQHQDLIRIYYRVYPLRNYYYSTVPYLFLQGFTQRLVCLEVERREAVVKNLYLRFFYERTSYGKSLFLAS